MKFSVDREALLKPLLTVQGVVERRQTLPILAHVLLAQRDGRLAITATDMEVELVAEVEVDADGEGEITVPARKFIDICRSLPPEARIEFAVSEERAGIRSGRSRFTLTTLPAAEYPSADVPADGLRLSVPAGQFKRLVDLTQFAMAHQDVRYYLNGLLLEIVPDCLRAVATDGLRLALAEIPLETGHSGDPLQIIVPRKGVNELSRLLADDDEPIEVVVGANAIQVSLAGSRFTSKLIDGRFPDYQRVIPKADDCDKQLDVDREALRQSLTRASILSNEKYRAIRLILGDGTLRLTANNPDQEEAEDEMEVQYAGEALEIGFNVSYLIEALGVVPSDTVRLYLSDPSSSCLIRPRTGADGEQADSGCEYVVMPMRL